LWIEQLLEEVRRALKAEGCRAEVEIARLWGARPGQRNWEIATVGPHMTEPEVKRWVADVQNRLGEKFYLRTREDRQRK
jgi:hypothetical protein